MSGEGKKFSSPSDALAYIKGGKGKATIRSSRTGRRYTYKFGRKGDSPVFVRVLTDGDNEGSYTYLGFIGRNGSLFAGFKGRLNAPSFKAFNYVLDQLRKGRFGGVDVWHEGVCGKCGRTLTVPESIESGMGPVCAGRLKAAA